MPFYKVFRSSIRNSLPVRWGLGSTAFAAIYRLFIAMNVPSRDTRHNF